MTKSKSQTDAEILASAKIADEVHPETMSLIYRRHTSSVHPVQCNCLIHRDIKKRNTASATQEATDKAKLDWYQGS
jgi:hypothetical protein